jgi:chitinase
MHLNSDEYPEDDEGPRIICYYQTHHLQNGDFVSLIPLISEATGVTHVILAAIHLNEGPGNIHLNDDPPTHPKFTALWEEVTTLQNAGIKVLGMLGGAAAGSFARLDGLEFESYYSPLRDMIASHSLDGLDLDVEEQMSLNGVIQLIDRLKEDFGNDFLITLAPVATALYSSWNLSGFDYHSLEAARGDKISWYNAQFYCGWGCVNNTANYDIIIESGWSASKVVVGLVTNPVNANGWVGQEVLETVLTQLKKMHPGFGGVMGWEYFNSLPGDEKRPWDWAAFMGKILRTRGRPANSDTDL